MKRATITMDGSGRVAVPSDIANVWMSEMELVTLFDVIAPTLRAAIRAVYKCGVLNPLEAEKGYQRVWHKQANQLSLRPPYVRHISPQQRHAD